jgi:hypothetical protein
MKTGENTGNEEHARGDTIMNFRLCFGDWRCLIEGCDRLVAAEVHDQDYKATIQAMGLRCPQKQPSRRLGSPRVFACAVHVDDTNVNAALPRPRWQALLMAA